MSSVCLSAVFLFSLANKLLARFLSYHYCAFYEMLLTELTACNTNSSGFGSNDVRSSTFVHLNVCLRMLLGKSWCAPENRGPPRATV